MSFTVLIIEDHADTRELYKLALRAENHTLQVYKSAREALEYLGAGGTAHAIVCDMMLPGMDGDEFIAELRKNPAWSAIRVIVVSGIDDLRERAAAMGAHAYLSKPFGLQQLIQTVREQLAHLS